MRKDGLYEGFIITVLAILITLFIQWIIKLDNVIINRELRSVAFLVIWCTVWSIVRFILRNTRFSRP